MKTDNEIIAEFMGQHVTPIGLRRNVMQKSYYADELKYHTSWSWLMPVVEKIESLGYCARIVRSGGERCVIYDPEIHNSSDVYSGKGVAASVNQEKKIEAVYKAVVEFIKLSHALRQNNIH